MSAILLVVARTSSGAGQKDPRRARQAGFAADRRWRLVSKVLLLTNTRESAAEILPSLSLLAHTVRLAAASADALHGPTPGRAGAALGADADANIPDAVLIDARRDLVRVRDLLRQLSGAGTPLLAVISEGAWAAITPEWGIDDVILHTAGPGEVEARLRLAIGRAASQPQTQVAAPAEEVRSGELVIDEATYSARIRGVALDLTFKEFELLKFLAQHPRRVFTRSQLLQEVWGYDYFGGTRTVDVHVRRLRAKLGTENEALIGTVRNVGYKFVPAKHDSRRAERGTGAAAASGRGRSGRASENGNTPGSAGPASRAKNAADDGDGRSGRTAAGTGR
jgi:DNA-binding response OmpR family regulator